MGRKKKLPRISVCTLPNGYSLTIEGHRHEYMYFSPEKLLEGIMVHVGLKMTEELSTDTIKSFIDSAIEFHNQKASHKELQKAQREVDKVNRKYRAIANKMIKERHRMLRLCNLAQACNIGHHSLTDALAALHARVHNDGQLKELTLSDFGITSDQITDDEPTDDGDDEDTE